MAIRNAAKAIIVKGGKVLLSKYISEKKGIYYELPGGGQIQFETMEEAVVRECMEETGYQVKVVRLAAIAEEIYDDIKLRNQYPDYVHRIHHIFIAEISGTKSYDVTEADINQVGCVWMDICEVHTINLLPRHLKDNLIQILDSENPLYLGVVHVDELD